jgi:hypothetical protein
MFKKKGHKKMRKRGKEKKKEKKKRYPFIIPLGHRIRYFL